MGAFFDEHPSRSGRANPKVLLAPRPAPMDYELELGGAPRPATRVNANAFFSVLLLLPGMEPGGELEWRMVLSFLR